MTRKPVLTAVALTIVLVGAGLFTLYTLLAQEPDFYQRAAVPPGFQRQASSRDFEKRAFALYDQTQRDTEWYAEFTDKEVNSYLAEDFINEGVAKELPKEISDPRFVFEPGRILLAFRYRANGLDTVVSVQAKVWVVQSEPNTIAVEIEHIKAGAVPLSHNVIQDHLTFCARALNIDVQWFHNEGKPVGILRLQKDRQEPFFQLEAIELRQGSVYLKGRSLDPDLRRAAETTLGLNVK